MSRTQRLLDLMQILRRHRYPVAGHSLAEELGISMRTLYRDIATLQQQGADIVGEVGIGYVLRPGFMLPPLMFSQTEIEALVLGMRWVERRVTANLPGRQPMRWQKLPPCCLRNCAKSWMPIRC